MTPNSPIHNPAGWLRITIMVIVSAVSQTPNVWAGAWTLPRGHAYAEYYYQYFGAKKNFNSEGHSSRKPKHAIFRDIRNEWKLEYGLTDWFNLLGSLPYQSSHYRDDNVDLLTTGIGDIHLRTKLRMTEEPLVSSVQFSWKIPGGYDVKESPALGDGQFDFETRLLLSRAWNFSPYTVPAHTPHAAKRAEAAQPQAIVSRARDVALRDAVLLAQLQLEGQRLARQGRSAEAEKWFCAAAQQELELAAMPLSTRRRRETPIEVATTTLLAAGPLPNASAQPLSLAAAEGQMETRYAGAAFVNLEGGFTARHGAPANEFPMVLESGFTPLKRLMLVGSLESVISVKSTHEDTEDFAKWGVRAIINLWGEGFPAIFRRVRQNQPSVNVEVGYSDIFAGRNTDDALQIFGKISGYF